MVFEHEDRLTAIDSNISLAEKMIHVHEELKARFPAIARIAAAIYDPQTDLLKTFAASSGNDSPLQHYQAKLAESPSLREILEHGRPRVVNDLHLFDAGQREHTLRIARQGYRASYTMPMYNHGNFFGFLFFNSYEPESFSEEVLRQIDPFGHLISLTIIHELSSLRTLLATVKTAHDMTNMRDSETGSHLDRMSRYSRLIARKLAATHGFSDEFVENVFVFSPLHDIGKIGIPDNVLLKPGDLTPRERELMQTHARRGRELIDRMLENFRLGGLPNIDMLRNIAELHHEAMDGSGYPYGRSGEDIPLEARIVAVADVFDALTSRRPYKPAWSNQEALMLLRTLSASKLDPECVQALHQCLPEVEEIQRQFAEDPLG